MSKNSFIIKNKRLTILLSGVLVLLLAGGIIVGVNIANYYKTHITKDVTFKGFSLSGKDQNEVTRLVEDEINSVLKNNVITISFNQNLHEANLADFEFSYDGVEVFEAAKKLKSGELDLPISYNEEALSNFCEEIEKTERIQPQQPSHTIKNSSLIVYRGVDGKSFDPSSLEQLLVPQVQSLNFEQIQPPEVIIKAEDIDIDQIYQQVHTVVANASYEVDSSGKLVFNSAVTGIDFDVNQAKEIINSQIADKYTIPLKITNPTKTVSDLKEEIARGEFNQLVSTYSTSLSNSSADRTFNIAKAAALINGVVIQPGEVFSFLSKVGSFGKEDGYKEATVYRESGVDTGYGGGVCQVSSTLYCVALYGDMDIVERHNHMYTVGYVPLGMDAAVTGGGEDLRFKNTYGARVKVFAAVKGNNLVVSIYSTEATDKNNYKVTINPVVTNTVNKGVTNRNNPNMPKGQTKLISKGREGCTVDTYKVVTLISSGAVVSNNKIHTTVYKMIPDIYDVGTG